MKQHINIFKSEDKNTILEMKNSTFTKEELAYITRQFGERKGPSEIARVMERLKDHGSTHPRQATGKEPLSVEVVEGVKNIFHRK